jgi:hypothetical protein
MMELSLKEMKEQSLEFKKTKKGETQEMQRLIQANDSLEKQLKSIQQSSSGEVGRTK